MNKTSGENLAFLKRYLKKYLINMVYFQKCDIK